MVSGGDGVSSCSFLSDNALFLTAFDSGLGQGFGGRCLDVYSILAV